MSCRSTAGRRDLPTLLALPALPKFPALPIRMDSVNPLSVGAQWITSSDHAERGLDSLPVLVKRFTVPSEATAATLHVACLGVLVASIDDEPVSVDVLEPGYSDWRRVGEHVSWDVSHLVGPGEHVLRFELGGGMYRSESTDGRWTKVRTDFGDIAIAAALEVATAGGRLERLVTDTTWAATESATVVANWVGGETYDARRERSDVDAWPNAVPARVPPGLELTAKRTPPLRVIETHPARTVQRRGDAWVADFGVNSAGRPVIDLPADARVRLRPAELLHEAGAVDVRTQGWGPVFHDVTTAGEPMTWRPRMSYNGMRYLEITGLDPVVELGPDDLRFEVVHAAVPECGGFTSTDERLEAIWHLIRQAIRSNMMSVFTDCPQREKLGYLEEIHALHDLLVRAYASGPILDWTLDLAIDAQRADGSIGLCVPEWEELPDPWRGDPNWGGAVVFLALARHRATGNLDVLRGALPAMGRYLDFLLGSRNAQGLVTYGLGDFNGKSIDEFRDVELVSTATVHKLLLRAADAADLVAAQADPQASAPAAAHDGRRWRAAAADVAHAFTAAFARDDGTIGPGTITAHVVALDAGLAPPTLIDTIEAQVIAAGHVTDVGAVVMAHLVELLACAGRHDTLLAITRVTAEPSYGYMLEHGATSLTECWDGPTFGFSQNHFMFGAIAAWFHEHVAGIRQAPGSHGWTSPLIAPADLPGIDGASGWFDAPTGRLEATWWREGDDVVIEGVAPMSVGATVRMPSGREERVRGPFRCVDRR